MDANPTDRVCVRCQCGAKLVVPRRALGRKARCPKCGEHIVLRESPTSTSNPVAQAPASSATAPPTQVPAGTSMPGRSTDRLKMRCHCGATLTVPNNLAGRLVRCPKCLATLSVPASSAAESASTEPPAPVAVGHVPEPSLPPDVGPADIAITSLLAAEPETYTLKPAEPLPAAPPPVLPATPSGAAKTCPGCHRQLPADARLCVECGIDLCSGRPVLMTDDDNLDRAYEYAERAIRWISWIVGVGVYPVASEAFGLRKPWVVRGIALLTILVSLWYMVVFIYNPDPSPDLAGLMLWWGQPKPVNAAPPPPRALGNDDYDELAAAPELTAQFSPQQIFTHVLLHADLLHLAGNMLFLMVLGSRVNALLGNLLTIVAYPLLAVGSSLIDMVAGAQRPLSPSLGASGAVMGLAGMYLVLFPIHRVHMAAWWRWGLVGRFNLNLKIFAVRGFWVVLAYIALDVAAVAFGLEDGIGHWAHIGGFLSGVVLALGLLVTRLVNAQGGDLLTALLKHRAWVIIGHPNRPERLWW